MSWLALLPALLVAGRWLVSTALRMGHCGIRPSPNPGWHAEVMYAERMQPGVCGNVSGVVERGRAVGFLVRGCGWYVWLAPWWWKG